ncbi:MAG: FAD assembly factor SdhE [Gammaproteobacteria bacterium]
MSHGISKLKWRCRRGMLELDRILLRYLEYAYSEADSKERMLFASLLELQDMELLNYFLGYESPDSRELAELVKKIQSISRAVTTTLF